MINPLHRLKTNTYVNPNTKTQNIFCRLNENLMTFLTLWQGRQEKKRRKKKSLLKCIQKSNVIKKIFGF